MGLDRKKLAIIHIIKKDLSLSDIQYRDILYQAAGVKSAKELDEPGFRKLMRHFVRSRYYRKNPSSISLKQKMYIKDISRKLDWSDAHLCNFVRKYYHKSNIDFLTRKDAANLIESLKNIYLRSD
jgi:hypothetical protein